MKTNFFGNLKSYGSIKATMALSYDAKTNLFSVSFLPKAKGVNVDPATKELRSLNFTATPEQLDTSFFENIEKPLKETLAFFHNTQSFMDQKKRAEEKTQREKARRETIKKEEEAIKKLMGKEEDIKVNARKIIKHATELKVKDPKNKVADEALKNVARATHQNELF